MNYSNQVREPKIAIRLEKNARMPLRAHSLDAGADLFALFPDVNDINPRIVIRVGEQILVDTGVAVQIPEGFAGFLHARSSQRSKGITCWGTGIIDAQYRGNLKVVISNQGQTEYEITPDKAIAQLVIQPVVLCTFYDSWNDTARGINGFGSTNT